MLVYRIVKDIYADDLTGFGAKMYGGRWNRPGVSALYTSETRSLALLELLVHFNSKEALKQSFVFMTIEIPEDNLQTINLESSFLNNNLGFNNEHLWSITDQYFIEQKVLGLRVQSVIIPQEFNVILNPLVFDSENIKVVERRDVVIDKRLVNAKI